jgi:hypothetical protein
MPELLFEIWRDGDGQGHALFRVHPQNDRTRLTIDPDAGLVHSFTARSGFDAFQQNNAWHDHGPWIPPDNLEDQPFTEEDAAEQRAYLRERKLD